MSAQRVPGCGHSSERLLEMVAADAELPENERPDRSAEVADCPDCVRELARLGASWGDVKVAAAAVVLTPEGLVQRVMDTVRGIRGRYFAEPVVVHQEGGMLTVAEHAVTLLARRILTETAAERGGMHVRAVSTDDDGLQVLVEIDYRVAVERVATVLRDRLRGRLAEELGAEVPPINIHVVDVHHGKR
jgi:uncharacterized alkaline shock family protein YloU